MYWPRLGTALAIAAHVWGMPACGQPNVVWASVPSNAPADYAAWADPTTCTIGLNRGIRPEIMFDPGYRCTLIVHEWGHLTGHGHSPDPRNVMNAVASGYWRCYTHSLYARPVP